MSNLTEMFNEASNVKETHETFLNGMEMAVKVVWTGSREPTADKGANIQLRVVALDGELEGEELFDTISFSIKPGDGAKAYNKKQFAKLKALGLDDELVAAAGTFDTLSKSLKDKTFRMRIKWQPVSEGYDRPMGEHVYLPADSGTTSAAPASNGIPGF